MTIDETLSLEERVLTQSSRGLPQLFVALQCEQPTAGGSRFGLADIDEVVLGRGGFAAQRSTSSGARRLALALPDRRMSTVHARIVREESAFVIEDSGSKNGTRVNGGLVSRQQLEDGDLLQLGCTFLIFRHVGRVRGDRLAAPAERTLAGMATLLPDLEERYERFERVACSRVPVLILGESGTGKELLARALHALSSRSGPFVPVNCGALASSLLESELFGHRKGAFSGAQEEHPGLVRSSDRGTLLFDEIGDLPFPAQAALLRVLQEREVLPVGATRPIAVDLRVVSATHRDLSALEREGRFRGDLRARLTGYTLRLTPLRERREDLGLLVGAMLRRLAPERAERVALAPEVGHALLTYDWPLNIRELEQSLAAALALEERLITKLPFAAHASSTALAREERALTPSEQQQRDTLRALLQRNAGNISAVARELGKERVQVRRWIKRYGLCASS